MIKVKTQEYAENNLAILNTKVTFFGIPIFKRENTTTNRMVVDGLISVKKPIKIKAFNNYETED